MFSYRELLTVTDILAPRVTDELYTLDTGLDCTGGSKSTGLRREEHSNMLKNVTDENNAKVCKCIYLFIYLTNFFFAKNILQLLNMLVFFICKFTLGLVFSCSS